MSSETILQKLPDRYSEWPDLTPDVLRPHVLRLLTEARRLQAQKEETWPVVTDCDRLDAAFAQLEGQGILCRHNFSISLSNAYAEIRGEIRKARGAGHEVRGFAFYHEQDVESALDGNLYMGYGSVDRDEAEDLEIGREIVQVLRAHGLSVQWNESLEERISIRLDWKRRQPR